MATAGISLSIKDTIRQADGDLHLLARQIAVGLKEPDKKQLRFNEIVNAAQRFYNDPVAGVRELVLSCDKHNHDLYVAKRPMWDVLNREYGWMVQNSIVG